MKTALDLIRYATQYFSENTVYYGHGTDNALDEAYALVIDLLGLSHDLTDDELDLCFLDNLPMLLEKIHSRVRSRLPVPYITKKAWFCGLPFYVDERVLIPRSPIAELIETRFSPWVDPDEVYDVLDLCTGSGCIAIACAYAFEHARIDASDLSRDALDVARYNIQQHGLLDRVRLFEGDLFLALPKHRYDIIVSNPPYVGAKEMEDLPNEYTHEPSLALASGEFGLDIVDRMLKMAYHYLKDDGILVVEVGNTANLMEEHYPRLPFVWLEFERGGEGVFLLTKQDLIHVG